MYTTYDMLDGQDKVYQRHYPDVMVLSDDEEHPYLYGHVLDFFHVNVRNSGPDSLLPLMPRTPCSKWPGSAGSRLPDPRHYQGFIPFDIPQCPSTRAMTQMHLALSIQMRSLGRYTLSQALGLAKHRTTSMSHPKHAQKLNFRIGTNLRLICT